MKTVYIIHGWTYTLDAWDACAAELRTRGVEPIFLTVPGLSEESSEVWTLDRYVSWLAEKLAGKSDVTLIGHSNGGRIAIAYTAQHPGVVSHLVLVDAAGIVHNELPLRLKRAIFGVIAKGGKKLTRSPLIRKIFYRLIRANDYERAPENMRATMANLIRIDLTEKLKEIRIPTLILWGEHDTVTPVSDAHVMKQNISHATLQIIKNTGHSPHKTHPAEVADAVKAFLA